MHKFSQAPSDPLFAIGRAILFRFEPEKAHDIALKLLDRAAVKKLVHKRYQIRNPPDATSVDCLGTRFDNPIGLAAGLDKNGDYIDALGAIGFGHIEIGTVTPKPQQGNPKPRMFRLAQHQSLINRLGFNNKGVDHLVEQVQRRGYKGKLGINIGKNASTALEVAHTDYLHCLEKVYPHADYITVNISSPNTAGLRSLQHGDQLKVLLGALENARIKLSSTHQRQVPIAVKIAPDMSSDELDTFCEQALKHHIDAIIVSNTTNQREAVANHAHADEAGGLSGKVLISLANEKLAAVAERVGNNAALIGVGGVSCGQDAKDKMQLGASLVQVYSGLIYQGPALIRDCISAATT